jgi:glycosyl hydrolase family 26
MYKASLKNFLLAKTSHRLPKLLTLALSSCVLVALVNIDASASAFGGRDSLAVRTDSVLTLNSESSGSQFSGLVKRWTTTSTVVAPATPPATPPATAAPTVSGSGSGSGGGGGGGGGTPATTTTTSPVTTTTTPPVTTTTTTPSAPASSGGLITAGPSRSECLVASNPNNTLADLQASINSFQSATNSTVTCIGAYTDDSQTWTDWSDPWIVGGSGTAYKSWVAEAPQSHQLVLEVDLIPQSLQNANSPLSWETSCAAGDFNSYATELGTNLVNAGLGDSVIRLGSEANGPWEGDFIGTTTQEQGLWASCFDNEVSSLRQAAGENFLIDWNVAACYEPIAFANYYPGNAYVDITGIDLYDQDCDLPSTAVTFSQLSNEAAGLSSFEAFSNSQGKPMSFPEWGLTSTPGGDDAAYINGIGSAVENGNFAFQEYFDKAEGNTSTIDSGSTPLSAAAYAKWFG